MEEILHSITAAGYRQLEGHGLNVYRYDPESDTFPEQWECEDGQIIRRYNTRVRRGGVTFRILEGGEPLLVRDVTQWSDTSVNIPQHIRSFVGVPVVVHSLPWGVLYVNSGRAYAFAEEDVDFVQSLARQIGLFLEQRATESAGNVELATVRVLAATVDAKDPYTRHHSTNVSFYARRLAREMNLEPAEVQRISLAALLHDIGKIAIPDQILQKPGKLTPEERLLVQTHAAIGANILAQAPHLRHLVSLVRHHHEKYDGTGYPDGLSGDEIPLGAAILSLADAFDTMTTRRIYRDALPVDQVLNEVKRLSGRQFHPDVVEAMLALIEKARFTREPWLTALGSAQEPQFELQEPAGWQATLTGASDPHRLDPIQFLLDARQVLLDDSLPLILERAAELLLNFWAADVVQVYLIDRETAMLNLAWNSGNPNLQAFIDACTAEGPRTLADGLTGWAVLTNQGSVVTDARHDPRWAYHMGVEGPVSVLVAPIAASRNPFGVLQVVARGEGRLGRQDLKVMRIFTTMLGQAIDRVHAARQTMERIWTDMLTGVRNANYLPHLLERLEREQGEEPLAVAFVDGDELKSVNDRFGHVAGDCIIQHMGRCLSALLRPNDVLVRYAGDEFMLFFPNLSLPAAAERLEQMRLAVSETPVELPDGTRIFVTVSCGVTGVAPGTEVHKAMRSAELAMYNAKRTGKNRVWTVAG